MEEFVKSCFDNKAVIMKEIGAAGRLAGRKWYGGLFRRVMRRWDMGWCVRLVVVTLRGVVLMGVF